jgi:hypothetical protein
MVAQLITNYSLCPWSSETEYGFPAAPCRLAEVERTNVSNTSESWNSPEFCGIQLNRDIEPVSELHGQGSYVPLPSIAKDHWCGEFCLPRSDSVKSGRNVSAFRSNTLPSSSRWKATQTFPPNLHCLYGVTSHKTGNFSSELKVAHQSAHNSPKGNPLPNHSILLLRNPF